MKENNTTRWSEGLRFVLFSKNQAFHSGIKFSDYEAMFGTAAKIELGSLKLPEQVLQSVSSEQELERVLNAVNGKTGENHEEKDVVDGDERVENDEEKDVEDGDERVENDVEEDVEDDNERVENDIEEDVEDGNERRGKRY